MAHKPVRALKRGILVLRSLQSIGPASLNDLHEATRLSRPTLLRLLATLEQEGLAWRRLSDGRYRASYATLSLAVPCDDASRLAEAAAPVLDRLQHMVIWPSDLAVLNHEHGTYLETLETTRGGTPFPVRRYFIGHHVNLALTALGRAYLAFCTEAERNQILKRLARSRHTWDHKLNGHRQLDHVLLETRKRGYGVRDVTFFGGDYEHSHLYDDRSAAIAVPLMDGDRVLACMNMLWLRDVASEAEMARKHLDQLRKAAADIVVAYQQLSGSATIYQA